MKCNCLKEVVQKSLDANDNQYQGMKINKGEIVEQSIVFMKEKNRLEICTYSTIEIEVEGRKRPVKISILHSFCPFCGIAIQ